MARASAKIRGLVTRTKNRTNLVAHTLGTAGGRTKRSEMAGFRLEKGTGRRQALASHIKSTRRS